MFFVLFFKQEFFNGLESHRAMLDALAASLDPTTRKRHQPQHAQLVNRTNALLDKAAVYGQKLERQVSQWENFDPEFDQARKQLHQLQQQCPTKVCNTLILLCLCCIIRMQLCWRKSERESDVAWNEYIFLRVVCLYWVTTEIKEN